MTLEHFTTCLLLALGLLALGTRAAHIATSPTTTAAALTANATATATATATASETAMTHVAAKASEADDDSDEDGDAAGAAAAVKNEVAAGVDESSLSIWSVVRGLWSWIREDLRESLLGDDDEVAGRTFGKIRRLQMALIPIVFKFGVLTAMVTFLVLLGLKTVFLLKVLLLMNAAALLGKFLTLKTDFGHVEHHAAPAWGHSSWSPVVSSGGWSEPAAQPAHPSKEIHLHIHGAQAHAQPGQAWTQSQGWERRSDPYGAYEANANVNVNAEAELTNSGPLAYHTTSFPSNHRRF